MLGTVLSMALQTLSFLWLGRLYPAEVMGVYEYFSTGYSILLIVATGRYELAIMLPKEENDGFLLVLLSAGLSLLFSLGMGVVFCIAAWLGAKLDWAAYLPLCLAVLGVYYSCNYWLNRRKDYWKLAVNRVLQGLLMFGFNLLFAYFLPDKRYGMIFGYILSQALVMAVLVFYLVRDYRRLDLRISFLRIKELAREYLNFPKMSCLSGVVNNLAVRLPTILLGVFAGEAVVGQYGMMNKILGAPITAISEAIRDVFRQKASREYAHRGECEATYRSTFRTLALVAVLPFLLIMLGGKPVLELVYGRKWEMAGTFILLMSPFYYVKFVVSPLTFMTYIAGKQGFDMKWQIAFCAASASAFGLGYLLTGESYGMMLCFGLAQTLLYGVSFAYTHRLSKGDPVGQERRKE